jgi:hypothetical protein
MQSDKQPKVNKGYSDTGGVKRKVMRPAPTEHGGMRFEMTARSAGEQPNCHVSEGEVHVNHFVNDKFGNVERGEFDRWHDPYDSEQIRCTSTA